MGTAKAPLIGFKVLYDGRMKGINTTTFRPLITPFEALIKVERKTSFLSQLDLHVPNQVRNVETFITITLCISLIQ